MLHGKHRAKALPIRCFCVCDVCHLSSVVIQAKGTNGKIIKQKNMEMANNLSKLGETKRYFFSLFTLSPSLSLAVCHFYLMILSFLTPLNNNNFFLFFFLSFNTSNSHHQQLANIIIEETERKMIQKFNGFLSFFLHS